MTLQVSIVRTPEEKQVAIDLRFRVFVHEQGFDPAVQVDKRDHDRSTVHLIAKDVDSNEFVAVARCLVDSEQRTAEVGRVAVLSKCRGKGYGLALVRAAEDAVRDRVDSFELLAQLDKKGFYERCGYQCRSDQITFNEGVAHCWMTKSAVQQ